MTTHTYKIVEIVGSSPNGTDEAIRNAIAEASKTLRHFDWFEVVETRPAAPAGFCSPRTAMSRSTTST